MTVRRTLTWLAVTATLAAACSNADDGQPSASSTSQPDIEVVADGLLNPIGLAMLPDGGILIAEEGTGEDDLSAGVSIITADGRAGRIVSGLPSGRDSGDLSGVPLVGVSPDGSTVYLAHFGSAALLSFSVPPGGLLPESKARPALTLDDLTRTLEPNNRVTLTNPFDISFSESGAPVVSDASQNGVASSDASGGLVFIHRFGSLPAPGQESLEIDPVPTGITRLGDEYLVTLTGGCPYPAGSGRLVAIDGNRGERVVRDGLNMPIDVAVDGNGAMWVLEFAEFDPEASCFTGEGYRPGTGRLRLIDADGDVLRSADGLDFPGAVLAMPDGTVLVSEVFSGRVVRLRWNDGGADPTSAAAAPTQLQFVNVATDVGIDFEHGAFRQAPSDDPAAMMGAGLCWIDYDADGRLDLYLVNSHALDEVESWESTGGLPSNALYRNGGGEFTDVSATTGAGLAMRGNGCIATDLDGDGWTDLFITADGSNRLLRNDAGMGFTDVTEGSGVGAAEWNTAAAAADLNRDGLVDLYVAAYIDLDRKIANPSGAFPQDYLGVRDHLFINQGGFRFEDGAAAAGLTREDRTLGAVFSDLDLDGDLDLYVANDGQPNRLFRNDSTPPAVTFTDVTDGADVGDPGSGMGIAPGDYSGDGAFDLLVTNWEAELNALYRNTADGSLQFENRTHRIGIAGLGNNKTGWGTAWADFDHDLDLDLLIAHGRVPVTDLASDPELVRLYRNRTSEGRAQQFVDASRDAGLFTVGPLLARGSAVADYDNDGDLDVAINTIGGNAALLENRGVGAGWLGVVFEVPEPGTRAEVELDDGTRIVRELYVGSSYLASEDPRLHFGLGDARSVTLIVTRPDGSETTLTNIAANQWIPIE